MASHQATPGAVPMMGSEHTSKLISRVVSVYDDEPATPLSAAAPARVTPCVGIIERDRSITGNLRHIERDYYIESSVIGTGHHGTVRKCVHRATGRQYAVKSICKSAPMVQPAGLAQEITLLREMKHESVVRLVDVYESSEYVHLLTDLYAGGELFERICDKAAHHRADTPCFSEDEAARTIYHLLKALSYLHDRGMVHRDLKPENVLFESADPSTLKLIDFGLSRKHDALREPPMSTVVGTPYYIAPEVLRRRYDKSCDAWSVGVIAYIVLCGYPPFNGADDRATARAVLRGRYCFLEEDWRAVGTEAMDFVHRLLQTDPRKRMAVAQALNHPWMVRHVAVTELVTTPGDVLDNSSVEVMYSGASRARRPTECRGSPMRKVRASMFGL